MINQERQTWPGRYLFGPPRAVPVSVRLRLLLGGFNNQFGWLFFGFGMVFVWLFGGSDALHNLAFFHGKLATVQGTITAVVKTNFSINDSPVYEYQYTYSVDGISCQGATKAFGDKFQDHDHVTIEYAVSDHTRSRIQGLSINTGGGLLIGAIFPVIGLVFIALGIRKGIKGARLLRNG